MQETRFYSGRTTGTASPKSKYDTKLLYQLLMDHSHEVVRQYSKRSYAAGNDITQKIQPKPKLLQIVRKVTGRPTIQGPLAAATQPLSRLLKAVLGKEQIWSGSSGVFFQSLASIVNFVYNETYEILVNANEDASRAQSIALSTAKIFCNFMLSTRLTYEAANMGDEEVLTAAEEVAETPVGREAAAIEAEASGGSSELNNEEVKKMVAKIKAIFRKLQMTNYIAIVASDIQYIAYAFVVNATMPERVNYMLYGRGTSAYSKIITTITESIVSGNYAAGGAEEVSEEQAVPANRKYSSAASYNEFGEDYEAGYESGDYLEAYEEEEYETEDEYEYEYEDEHEDVYEDEYEDELIGLEEESYEDYPQSTTAIQPTTPFEGTTTELVRALKNIKPSARSYSLAKKFLATRHFSNTLEFKRRLYQYLIDTFVNSRSFAKSEKEDVSDAIAEVVDKIDAVKSEVSDVKEMVAKAIEATEAMTSPGESEEEGDNESWDNFWRSGESEETEDQDEAEAEEEVDIEEEGAEGEEGEADEESAKAYYAKLKHYRKRNLSRHSKPSKAKMPSKRRN